MSFENTIAQSHTYLVLLNIALEVELFHEIDARVVVRALDWEKSHRLAAPTSERTMFSKTLVFSAIRLIFLPSRRVKMMNE
jgi:hypothetical protein